MTQPFTTAELDAIRAAAEAATPGPWKSTPPDRNNNGRVTAIIHPDVQPWKENSNVSQPRSYETFVAEFPEIIYSDGKGTTERHSKVNKANRDYISLLDPATVLRLVEQARPMEWKNEYPKTPGDWLLAGGQFLKNVCVFQMWDEEKVRAFSGENPQQDIFYYGPLPKPPEAK